MTGYNYSKFDAKKYELVQFRGPEMGTKAPPVDVTDLHGKSRPLLDFDGDFLVVEFGSYTCPLFQSRRKKMAGISAEFPNVSSIILYVREAHPGKKITSHADLVEKTDRARHLQDVDGEGRDILIDDLDGRAHQAYGSYPNAVFIINKNGCVVYRSAWNNASATRRALRRLVAGKSVHAEGYFLPPKPPIAISTFRKAGRGSASDFFRGLPHLAWNNLILRNLRLFTGHTESAKPDMSC